MATKPLLPDPGCLTVDSLSVRNGVILFAVRTTRRAVACPHCGYASERVHSRYHRTLTDLPWQGNAVRIEMTAQKFFCDHKACSRRIFTEPLPVVVARYARKTARLSEALQELTLLVGGEAAARIAKAFGLVLSPDALLDAVRKAPTPAAPMPRVLGIDDFAFRRGHVYGTILVDLERHRPVDLLPDREAATVAKWLSEHPGVEIISRDRGTCYKDGATQGAPTAIQVADQATGMWRRWHLLKNLGDALESLLRRQHRHLREAARRLVKTAEAVPLPEKPEATQKPPPKGERLKAQSRERRESRYQQVRSLHAQGFNVLAIVRQTGLSPKTIRKYRDASTCPDQSPRPPVAGLLAPYKEYLRQRWQEGCHNAAVLFAEIVAKGYRGKATLLRAFVRQFRARSPDATSQRVGFQTPAPSRVRWWLLDKFHPKDADRASQERDFVESLCGLCPEVKEATDLARAFGVLVRGKQESSLDGWLSQAGTCSAGEIRTFARGLLADEAAVRAALSQEWSNGQVEGQVNRVKFLKRSMYGRAGFDLLRARVLHRVAA